jgi:S-adenosylmethionine/arginine decarboxylase-like enzyme
MHVCAVALRGAMDEARWREFLTAMTAAIGMNPVGEPATWTYPIDGLGGTGQTIVLPITESFLALDTWPDHGGAYLVICSCKPITASTVYRTVFAFGLDLGDAIDQTLDLHG